MDVKAKINFLRIAPRKVRLVANLIRGKGVEDALNILQLTKQKAAIPLAKLIKSAISNADVKGGINVDSLIIKKLTVDQGPMYKRYLPRARGHATQIQKKTSHVSLVLSEGEI